MDSMRVCVGKSGYRAGKYNNHDDLGKRDCPSFDPARRELPLTQLPPVNDHPRFAPRTHAEWFD